MVIYGILENDRPGAGRFWRVGSLELRIATASVRTGFAMTGFLQGVRCAGRCGERTERCRWQRKRSERVAAVKILSVRRKAAQKFWAPQQDHRPLRMRCRKCGEVGDRKGRPYGKRLPLSGEPLGVRIATTSLRTGLAMTGSFTWGAVKRDDVGIVPYGEVIDGAGCGGTYGCHPTEVDG